jgi:hypothetical protein
MRSPIDLMMASLGALDFTLIVCERGVAYLRGLRKQALLCRTNGSPCDVRGAINKGSVGSAGQFNEK